MANWYAVHAKARQEPVARDNLERQAYTTYLPMIWAAKRRRNRWHSVAEPLFPGYLFVEIDTAVQSTAPIHSTRGAIGLVRLGGEIRPVPRSLIEGLMRSQAARDTPIDPAAVFKEGDRVNIVDGAFAGAAAIFQCTTGAERVCVLLDLLGRSNRVTISPHQIAPAC